MPSALAVFTCRPNSHPFQERHVYLDEPVKIGRSVARCRPAQNNATFDCKVLSRNHALVWFDHKTGKFYLQDTKSSNGTFINSQRLSRGSEESPPCEVLSGDIIQFGVDVTENTRKVTHGCIVSTIKLFLPDGMEARRRSDTPFCHFVAHMVLVPSQEALHREQMLEQKLATLQRLLASTQEASESSWQALIDEDRLLSRLEVMGNQLQAYSKNQTEDGIRKELVALQEDKHNYETTAKESLRRVLQEKIEVVRKLSEVERSLSNTEDECTHLKEMNDRTQEELRELANKYNGAVNEIKDLTDKIKLAEGRQEELTQKGQNEKKELQMRIDEMEEREQALQARIEALQADNDFSNERLTALQVSPFLLDHFLLKSGADSTFIQQFIDGQLVSPMSRLPSENQLDARESDMSDTLSPSKEKSSEDTSDGQMDEQELNEPLNEVALLKEELRSAHLDPSDTQQVVQHLHRELLEAQELANIGKQKCLELQALLEEEKKTNRQQTEDSARQIQFLQAQLQKLQSDMEALREQREGAITEAREELQAAQEEALALRRAMAAGAAERERDIAALQGDLGAVTTELEKWRHAAAKYEAEITVLQASFQQQSEHQERVTQLQGELEKLQEECSELQKECAALRDEKAALLERLQQLEVELDKWVSSSWAQHFIAKEAGRGQAEDTAGTGRRPHQEPAEGGVCVCARARACVLPALTHDPSLVQYEDTQSQLSDLKVKYERTEQEKRSIHQELEQCRVNLKLLQEKGSNPSILQPAPAIFIGLILALLYWCYGQLW
uniref:Sarcolemmal membrane-associated protein n=1 Tax=Scleropages formosus TaxID=113540 RepID=A0A8C9VKE4_SCLFO